MVAAFVGFELWVLVNPSVPPLYRQFWPALSLFLLAYWLEGLYPGVSITPVEQLRRCVQGTSIVYLILTTAIFLEKDVGAHSRGVFICCWLLSVALVPFLRAIVCHLFSARSWFGAPVLLLGAGKTAQLLIKEFRSRRALGFRPMACLDDDPSKLGECEGVPVLGPTSMAGEIGRSLRIRYVIVAMPGLSRAHLVPLIERLSSLFPHVIVIPDLFGVASLWVAPTDLGGVLGLHIRHNLLIPFNRWLKRVMDLTVACAGLIAGAPVIALSALLIKRVSPGRAFYCQEREGLGGRTIRVLKLRTMYPEAEKLLSAYLERHPEARHQWERYCKLKNDPRILPIIGRLLRRTSLDELPQLWNVLKGEMSLVGPRPFPRYHTAKFAPEFCALRRRVKPGLTGLWQISARSDGDIDVQTALDTYYIRNWSLWLDLYILSRTARAVLFGNGAY